jgi:SAM-dependent methyltransferase
MNSKNLEIISPLTGTKEAKLVDTISSKDIIDLYKAQLGMDVANYFKDTPAVNIYQCIETGYKFYYPESVMGDGKFYEDLQRAGERKFESYYRKNLFDHQFGASIVGTNDKVLEIGCGTGFFLESLLDKTDQVTGIELNPYAVSVCKEKGLSVFNELIESHSSHKGEYYDVVCSFQVLEHVYDVRNFIEYSVRTLKPGGKLILSVPNNEPYFLRYNKYETLNLPPHHMGLWNKAVFEKLQDQFPLVIKDVIFSDQYNWKVDAYYRAKMWIGSKSLIKEHSLFEKIKLLALSPFSLYFTLSDLITKKIRGAQMCVLFQKSKDLP